MVKDVRDDLRNFWINTWGNWSYTTDYFIDVYTKKEPTQYERKKLYSVIKDMSMIYKWEEGLKERRKKAEESENGQSEELPIKGEEDVDLNKSFSPPVAKVALNLESADGLLLEMLGSENESNRLKAVDLVYKRLGGFAPETRVVEYKSADDLIKETDNILNGLVSMKKSSGSIQGNRIKNVVN